MRFEPSVSDYPDDFGHYYTEYNPRTREGQGIFGTIEEPVYIFKFRLVFAPEYGKKVLIKYIRPAGTNADWREVGIWLS